jgi:hypothetical protein
MSIRSILLSICVLSIVFMTTTAHADVVYTFSGTVVSPSEPGGSLQVGFTYTAPDFLFAPGAVSIENNGMCINCIILLSAQLDSCLNCLTSTVVHAVAFAPTVFDSFEGSQLEFNDNNNVGSGFQFQLGAFAAPGTYTSSLNPGTLTVTATEPGSLSLSVVATLALGLICFFRPKVAPVA